MIDYKNLREKYAYWGLLISLLLSFSITPMFDESARSLNIFIVSSLLFALIAIASTRARLIIASLLGIPFVTLNIISTTSPAEAYLIGFYLLTALFFIYVISVLLRDIFTHSRVDTNRLLSAISVYLCFGVVCAMLYGLIDIYDLRSFDIPSALSHEARINNLMYFSFVTLTTLGYGDISPISDVARSLSTVEALVGQIYLTVLVARLVGLHIAEQSTSQKG